MSELIIARAKISHFGFKQEMKKFLIGLTLKIQITLYTTNAL